MIVRRLIHFISDNLVYSDEDRFRKYFANVDDVHICYEKIGMIMMIYLYFDVPEQNTNNNDDEIELYQNRHIDTVRRSLKNIACCFLLQRR